MLAPAKVLTIFSTPGILHHMIWTALVAVAFFLLGWKGGSWYGQRKLAGELEKMSLLIEHEKKNQPQSLFNPGD